jgi:hypothetical protein
MFERRNGAVRLKLGSRRRQKIEFFFKQIFFQKILKLKIYNAKWTLRIEVVNGNFFIFLLYFQSLFSNRTH